MKSKGLSAKKASFLYYNSIRQMTLKPPQSCPHLKKTTQTPKKISKNYSKMQKNVL